MLPAEQQPSSVAFNASEFFAIPEEVAQQVGLKFFEEENPEYFKTGNVFAVYRQTLEEEQFMAKASLNNEARMAESAIRTQELLLKYGVTNFIPVNIVYNPNPIIPKNPQDLIGHKEAEAALIQREIKGSGQSSNIEKYKLAGRGLWFGDPARNTMGITLEDGTTTSVILDFGGISVATKQQLLGVLRSAAMEATQPQKQAITQSMIQEIIDEIIILGGTTEEIGEALERSSINYSHRNSHQEKIIELIERETSRTDLAPDIQAERVKKLENSQN